MGNAVRDNLFDDARPPAASKVPGGRAGVTMRRGLALAVLVPLMVAACGGDDADDTQAGGADGAGKADRVVEIRMLATKRFQPESIAVKVGETVTFKVINEDKDLHEFTIGDTQLQADREKEMRDMGPGSMEMDDEAHSLTVKGGTTEELTWTFTEAGTVLYGCHQRNDYADGMRGTINVS